MLSRMRDSALFRRLAAVGPGLRDSLIRDNKVIPWVLGVLVLLILFWIFVGFFLGGQEDEPVSNRAFKSQSPELAQQSGATGAPSPELSNRNADSYAAYQSKDPFRELIPPADSASATPSPGGDSTGGDSTGGGTPDDGTSSGSSAPSDSSSAPSDSSSAPSSGSSAPSDSASAPSTGDGTGGRGGGFGGRDSGGGNGFGRGSGGGPGGGAGGGSGGGGGRGGSGNLFDSGGSLPY